MRRGDKPRGRLTVSLEHAAACCSAAFAVGINYKVIWFRFLGYALVGTCLVLASRRRILPP